MSKYWVNNIYPAVQGEGVQTGVAMVLLRLHGCGVGCLWCDTKESWEMAPEFEMADLASALGASPQYVAMAAGAIASYIRQTHPGPRWVLLTGGEPAEQDLGDLVAALHRQGYQVALETSGTALGHLDADLDWVCVSPKINMPGGKAILPQAIFSADEIKHVVGRPADIVALDKLLADMPLKPGTQICLQPLSQSQKATILCVETVQSRGWRLSVQMHKYLDLP